MQDDLWSGGRAGNHRLSPGSSTPPSQPHYPYSGDHYNLYKALQNPHNCRCQWKRLGAADASGGQSPPAGSIPIEPFAIPEN